jgi:molybdopterin-guanine dinucleotide biosynthesis protein A
MTASPVYGLVLAGGKSRRMGIDKALLQRDGKSQLTRMHELLGSCVDKVFVSARPSQADDPERSRFELIFDQYDDIGPVAGILSAMEQYPHADWLVVACDLPNVDAETLQNLIENRRRQQPFTAYRSSYDDLPEPLCAIYAAGSDVLLRSFVDAGMVCPRKILIESDTCLLQQPRPDALDNVNTPADLRQSVLESAS